MPSSLEAQSSRRAAPGPLNLITDVAGIKVGNADDARLRSGVTVVLPDEAAVAAVDVRGGAPGTVQTDILGLASHGPAVHGIVLSGGSALGLDAAAGAQSFLRSKGIGFNIRGAIVPIVPQAIIFDLLNGGDKGWGRRSPYQDLAWAACEAAGEQFAIGTAGGGYGATTATVRGGLGSASFVTPEGITVGALAVVNPVGSATIGASEHFWAAPLEIGDEYGGRGWPAQMPADAFVPRLKGGPLQNTTIAVVATDAQLSRADAQRLAMAAQTGLTRAIYPVHAPLDGDTVFALATGRQPLSDPVYGLAMLGAYASNTLARAIARAVYAAEGQGSWRERFGG